MGRKRKSQQLISSISNSTTPHISLSNTYNTHNRSNSTSSHHITHHSIAIHPDNNSNSGLLRISEDNTDNKNHNTNNNNNNDIDIVVDNDIDNNPVPTKRNRRNDDRRINGNSLDNILKELNKKLITLESDHNYQLVQWQQSYKQMIDSIETQSNNYIRMLPPRIRMMNIHSIMSMPYNGIFENVDKYNEKFNMNNKIDSIIQQTPAFNTRARAKERNMLNTVKQVYIHNNNNNIHNNNNILHNNNIQPVYTTPSNNKRNVNNNNAILNTVVKLDNNREIDLLNMNENLLTTLKPSEKQHVQQQYMGLFNKLQSMLGFF